MADAMASLIGAQFAAKRKSPETALPEDESSFKGTAISTADGAKVLKDLDSTITEYESLTKQNKNVTSLGIITTLFRWLFLNI